MKYWQEFYQVVVVHRSGERETIFKSGNSIAALNYARSNIVSPEAIFDRIEVREHFGAEVVQTVWVSDAALRTPATEN
jgi:hypothetical protein